MKKKKMMMKSLNVSSSPLVAYDWYRQSLETPDEFTKLCLEVGITFRHCRRDGFLPYVQEANNVILNDTNYFGATTGRYRAITENNIKVTFQLPIGKRYVMLMTGGLLVNNEANLDLVVVLHKLSPFFIHKIATMMFIYFLLFFSAFATDPFILEDGCPKRNPIYKGEETCDNWIMEMCPGIKGRIF